LKLVDRYYARQFKNRKTLNNKISNDFSNLVQSYNKINIDIEIQQPTVQYFSENYVLPPYYLSDTVRYYSDKSALTIIHDVVIEEAKKRLTTSSNTISEISYQLGFEYPNYFSRLFKKKVNQTPSEYRRSVKSI